MKNNLTTKILILLFRHFVPNLTIGPPVVKSLRSHTKVFLDCHLMIEHPEKWIKDFKDAGANQITFHLEATENPVKVIEAIKEAGLLAAIAIKPKTPVEKLIPYLDFVNMVLIMTVEPGFGGQSFMADMMPKVEYLRKLKPSLNIQVDGGIGPDTIDKAAKAGANIIVSGSAIFKNGPSNYAKTISILRESVLKHQKERLV